jgi:hypothetical protein
MKTINRENYEEYCLDYLEGNLSEDLKSEFDEFINENPDLENEVQDVELFYLTEPENIVFSDKKSLMKKTTPVVIRMRPMYWKWAVAAACFLGIVGGVLFVQSNQDIPTFADVNTPDEVINESVPNTDKETNQNSNYEVANVEPEIINTPEEIVVTNSNTNKPTRKSSKLVNIQRLNDQSIAVISAVQPKGIEIPQEIENESFIENSTDNIDFNRVAYNEIEYLETTQRAIAFESTSRGFDSNDIPKISVSESKRDRLFGKRYDLEERGLLSDAYAYAVSKEELKESLTPDTYKLEINKEELREAIIPESFAAVFK